MFLLILTASINGHIKLNYWRVQKAFESKKNSTRGHDSSSSEHLSPHWSSVRESQTSSLPFLLPTSNHHILINVHDKRPEIGISDP